MDEVSLYEHILQLHAPWFVDHIELDKNSGVVTVHVDLDDGCVLECPTCGKPSPRYDRRNRRWRHLDTCQFETHVVADVPRVQCPEHGCLTIAVSWASSRSRFTQMFEALIIDWLHVASVSAVGRLFHLSWNAVDGIMQRAVERGLARRARLRIERLGIDETSFKKGHDYITVVTDQHGHVIDVQEGRGKDSLKRFYDQLDDNQKYAIQSISMDMAPAYIATTLVEIPDARSKIAFDKYHVAASLNKAVDDVRKQERIELFRSLRYREVRGHRFLWLRNSTSLRPSQRDQLNELHSIAVKTGRAWALKEFAMSLWDYQTRGWAKRRWLDWYSWAVRSRLMPIRIVARQIKTNLWGIVNAIVHKATNAMAESVNSKIKILKTRARGFRNRLRFKTAILFHYGGLDLHP